MFDSVREYFCPGCRTLLEVESLPLAGLLTVQASRRLPPPYTAWAITGLLLPLSVPALDEPLKSLARCSLRGCIRPNAPVFG